MRFTAPSLTAALVLATLAQSPAARAGTYTYTSLVPAGSIQPVVGGMNDSDEVVGTYIDPKTYLYTGFLWSKGVFTPIAVSKFGTMLTSINASGLATGCYYTSKAHADGVFCTPMIYDTKTHKNTTPKLDSRYSTILLGINDSGSVIGTQFFGNDQKAVIGTATKLSLLTTPTTPYVTLGQAIGDNGEIVVDGINLKNDEVAFTYKAGKFTALQPPHGASVNGFGCASAGIFINKAGVIGGNFGTSAGTVKGYTLSGGVYTIYAYPGTAVWSTTVSGASATGMVAGCYSAGQATTGFVHIAAKYHPIQFPGAADTYVIAVNDQGSLAGNDNTAAGSGVFIAQCAKGQEPCTK
jgi:hypothetical protein